MPDTSRQAWVAWLRGVNPGGERLLTPEDLGRVFSSVGLESVRPHIPSGYVAFTAPAGEREALQKRLEETFRRRYSSETRVVLRTREALGEMLARDPFASRALPDAARRYVSFLAEPPRFQPTLPLVSPHKDLEIIGREGWDVYSVGLPDKNGRVGVPNTLVEREYGTWATTRLWSSLKACLE